MYTKVTVLGMIPVKQVILMKTQSLLHHNAMEINQTTEHYATIEHIIGALLIKVISTNKTKGFYNWNDIFL